MMTSNSTISRHSPDAVDFGGLIGQFWDTSRAVRGLSF